MDAGAALDELTRLSAEIESAAVVGPSGVVVAATSADAASRLGPTAAELLEVASLLEPQRSVDRVTVQLATGSVFVVRSGGHVAVATTGPEPAAALVTHDLRACLAGIDEPERTLAVDGADG